MFIKNASSNDDNPDWPFYKDSYVYGMKFPLFLAWASETKEFSKKLYLPIIQRGFVWKPKQIVELWDSLLRGMPIGSFMVSELSKGMMGKKNNEAVKIDHKAIGLLDGQQRTMAMLLGWQVADQHSNNCLRDHCLWMDLGAGGQNSSSPFEIRITTRAKPFGFQHSSHTKLSLGERKNARKEYNKQHNVDEKILDCELFDVDDLKKPKPWNGNRGNTNFLPLRYLWDVFRNKENSFKQVIKEKLKNADGVDEKIDNLYAAFKRLESMEVPLVLVRKNEAESNDQQLLVLFERIGSNGTKLSSEDLLFSIIKQEWPQAHKLVQDVHKCPKVSSFTSQTDYVMTAFRLAAIDVGGIADNPRPTPKDFHRHIGKIISKSDGPLNRYLEKGELRVAFNLLYDTLHYRNNNERDLGIPWLLMPHLSRGLIQVLLRWIIFNKNNKDLCMKNREKLIAFALFWTLCVYHEDNSSKVAFNHVGKEDFPAESLYRSLTDRLDNDKRLMFPLIKPERMKSILINPKDSLLRSRDKIFTPDSLLNVNERELYKRFCWWRKPVLLWLQREYVEKTFQSELQNKFAGVTDEDAVPYDYDHLCPYNHWGSYWGNIKLEANINVPKEDFRYGRSDVGNCIGNLHVLESSLNRSLGDSPFECKLKFSKEKQSEWRAESDSLISQKRMEELLEASPKVDDKNKSFIWDEKRVRSFQSAIYGRALELYGIYFDACKCITEQSTD